jgi:NAD(P)-dependent dehydrogenase (short-subunit alcohol dehydrogenase family)
VPDLAGKVVVVTGAARGQGVTYRHLDVRDAAAWDALAGSLRERHGRVDALVNNAGVAAHDAAYYNGAEIVIDGGLTAHVSHKRIADATATNREGIA